MKLDPWPYPLLFAHRGGGSLAPENTMAAMRVGHAEGYRAVEFDVKLDRTHTGILLHDDTLERTTSGHGRARDFAYGELALLDAGLWHSKAYQFEPIPRFDAVAWFLISHNMMANVEIKPCEERDTETGEVIARLAGDYWAKQGVKCLLSSFSETSLDAAMRAAPQLPRGFLTKVPQQQDWAILERLGCVSFHFWEGAATQALIAEIHARGYRALVWTVNDVARARQLIDWGIDGIFTDNLREFAAAFPNLR